MKSFRGAEMNKTALLLWQNVEKRLYQNLQFFPLFHQTVFRRIFKIGQQIKNLKVGESEKQGIYFSI